MSKATVIATLNPITKKSVMCDIPGKGRLSDHLVTPEGAIIYRNGEPYENGELFPNDLINIILPPQGEGNGKDIARTGIILAAQIGAAALTGGLSTIAQAAIVGAVSVGASIGVNALIPPPNPSAGISGQSEQFTRLGALTGSRNQVNPYGVVPRVYGKRKLYPPMSAKPFTSVLANKQYMTLLFCLGAGPLQLSEPKIGDTVIGTFDSSNNFTSNENFDNIQIDVAESPDLYSDTVDEVTVNANLDVKDDQILRTTAVDTDRFSIDLFFPQGLFSISDTARTHEAYVDFLIELSPAGQNDWKPAAPDGFPIYVLGSLFSRFTHMGNGVFRANHAARESLRVGMELEVDNGQYDIRITRQTGEGEGVDTDRAQVFDSAVWSVIRSTTYQEPTDLPGVVQLAMKIQATDQFSGVLDNFSVEVESRLAFYDGTAWDEPTFNTSTGNGTGGIVTSNPAWIIADVLCGNQNARALDRSELDADSFKSFADNCVAEGRMCNLVIDSPRTVLQTVSLIGSTGRGSLAIHDGLYKIIEDDEKDTPVQHFTPRNSWGFGSVRTFPKVPHALRVNFVNPDSDWQTDEAIVYDDGYSLDGTNCQFDDGTGVCKTATRFETLDLEGVTSWDQAWKEGRFRLAEARLRPERYSFMADVENIVCQRGDLVYVSHDVTMWGLKTGRIKSINALVLTLDEQVTMEAGKNYNIRVRNKQGQSIVKTVTTDAGTHNDITVDGVTDIEAGDLFMFGLQNTETQPLKVFSIEPRGDLTARITCIDAAPEIYDAPTGTIPDFDSNITLPAVDPNTVRPPEPIITGIRSDGDSLYPDSDGDPSLRILVSYTVGSGAPTELVEGRFRRDGDTDGWTAFGQSEASTGTLVLKDADRGGVYIVQLRARRGDLKSDWVQSTPHTAGQSIVLRGRPDNAVGYITKDLNGLYTSIPARLFVQARKGVDYDIIHELERDNIPITPTSSAGPGQVFLFIEEQFIEAPEGSYILKNSTQEEAEQTDRPDFEFVGDTLQVINGELKATMDLIAEGEKYGRVHKDSINELGEIISHEFEGDLDDLKDGEFYARVRKSALTDTGLVFVDALIGTLDDMKDGVNWKRASSSALDANGLVVLNAVQGDLDDIAEGTVHGKVDRSALDANGLVIVSALVGDYDDLNEGTTYKRVLATNISAGNIKILGPDGQTVIDQGTIDTDAIFASTATITKKLTMGTGGVISNTANDYTIDSSGISVETTDSFLGSERTLGVEGRGGLWGVTTGASLNLSSSTGIPIDIQAGTASGNAILRFVSNRTEFGSRMKLVNLTETERDNLTGNQAGDVIYNTSTARPNYYNGTAWSNF